MDFSDQTTTTLARQQRLLPPITMNIVHAEPAQQAAFSSFSSHLSRHPRHTCRIVQLYPVFR